MTQIELLLLPHEPENSISYCYPRVYFTYQSELLQDIMSQPQHFATLNALKSNIQPHAVRYFKKRHTSKTSNYEIKKTKHAMGFTSVTVSFSAMAKSSTMKTAQILNFFSSYFHIPTKTNRCTER